MSWNIQQNKLSSGATDTMVDMQRLLFLANMDKNVCKICQPDPTRVETTVKAAEDAATPGVIIFNHPFESLFGARVAKVINDLDKLMPTEARHVVNKAVWNTMNHRGVKLFISNLKPIFRDDLVKALPEAVKLHST
jgi:hypothetical protein